MLIMDGGHEAYELHIFVHKSVDLRSPKCRWLICLFLFFKGGTVVPSLRPIAPLDIQRHPRLKPGFELGVQRWDRESNAPTIPGMALSYLLPYILLGWCFVGNARNVLYLISIELLIFSCMIFSSMPRPSPELRKRVNNPQGKELTMLPSTTYIWQYSRQQFCDEHYVSFILYQ